MDILIKNIGGLPEDGDLTLTITPKGQVILGGCFYTSNFGKEVKAVALPEHGRLISDRDVKDLLRSGLSLDTDADIDHVCGLIDGLPTIVEAFTRESGS